MAVRKRRNPKRVTSPHPYEQEAARTGADPIRARTGSARFGALARRKDAGMLLVDRDYDGAHAREGYGRLEPTERGPHKRFIRK